MQPGLFGLEVFRHRLPKESEHGAIPSIQQRDRASRFWDISEDEDSACVAWLRRSRARLLRGFDADPESVARIAACFGDLI